jgi:hypothetical protein
VVIETNAKETTLRNKENKDKRKINKLKKTYGMKEITKNEYKTRNAGMK